MTSIKNNDNAHLHPNVTSNTESTYNEKPFETITITYANKTFTCQFCNKSGNGPKFQEHLIKHLLRQPYMCLHCSHFFSQRSEIGAHIQKKHPGNEKKTALRSIKRAVVMLNEAKQKGYISFRSGFRHVVSESKHESYFASMENDKACKYRMLKPRNIDTQETDAELKSESLSLNNADSSLLSVDVNKESSNSRQSGIKSVNPNMTDKNLHDTKLSHSDLKEKINMPENHTVLETENCAPSINTSSVKHDKASEQPSKTISEKDPEKIHDRGSDLKTNVLSNEFSSCHHNQRKESVEPAIREKKSKVGVTKNKPNRANNTSAQDNGQSVEPGKTLNADEKKEMLLNQNDSRAAMTDVQKRMPESLNVTSQIKSSTFQNTFSLSRNEIHRTINDQNHSFASTTSPLQHTVKYNNVVLPQIVFASHMSPVATPVCTSVSPVRLIKAAEPGTPYVYVPVSPITLDQGSPVQQNCGPVTIQRSFAIPAQTSCSQLYVVQNTQQPGNSVTQNISSNQTMTNVNNRSSDENSNSQKAETENSYIFEDLPKSVDGIVFKQRDGNEMKKTDIFIAKVNNEYFCGKCRLKWKKKDLFWFHLWNHQHIGGILCNRCVRTNGPAGELTCTWTDYFINKLHGIMLKSNHDALMDNLIKTCLPSDTNTGKECSEFASTHLPCNSEKCATNKTAVSNDKNVISHNGSVESAPDVIGLKILECKTLNIEEFEKIVSSEKVSCEEEQKMETQCPSDSQIDNLQLTSETESISEDKGKNCNSTITDVQNVHFTNSIHSKHNKLESLLKTPTYHFYVCGSNCSFSCLFPGDFKQHLSACKFRNRNTFPCFHCGFVGESVEVLMRHVHKHAACHKSTVSIAVNAVFVCSFTNCKFTTNVLSTFYSHCCQAHADEISYTCSNCEQSYPTAEDIAQHLKDNLLTVVSCKHCLAKDTEKKIIMAHILVEHPGKGKILNALKHLLCKERKIYGYPFQNNLILTGKTATEINTAENETNQNVEEIHSTNSKQNLNESQEFRESTAEDVLCCHICSFVASDSNLLNEHFTCHKQPLSDEDSLNFACPSCPLQVNTLKEFEDHAECHTENVSYHLYNCTCGEFQTSQRTMMLRHIKMAGHPYENEASCLQGHEKHIVSKVLKCTYCRFKTTCVADLDEHLKGHVIKTSKAPALRVAAHSTTESDTEGKNFLPKQKKMGRPNSKDKRHVPQKSEVCSSSNDTSRKSQSDEDKIIFTIPSVSVYETSISCPKCYYTADFKSDILKHIRKKHPLVVVKEVPEAECLIQNKLHQDDHPDPRYSDPPLPSIEDSNHNKDGLEIGCPKLDRELATFYRPAGHAFVCSTCSKKYSKKTLLHHHILDHLKLYLWKCKICDFQDNRRYVMINHAKNIHSSSKRVVEPVNNFLYKLSEYKNKKQNSKKLNIEVPLDNSPLSSNKMNEKLKCFYKCLDWYFECLVCKTKCNSVFLMNKHILKSHLKIALFGCSLCWFEGFEENEILQHMYDQHPSEVSVALPLNVDIESSVKAFVNSSPSPTKALLLHNPNTKKKKLILGNDDMDMFLTCLYEVNRRMKLVCLICKDELSTKYSVHRHLLSHLDVNLVGCSCCDYKALSDRDVADHMKINHAGMQLKIDYLDVDIAEAVKNFFERSCTSPDKISSTQKRKNPENITLDDTDSKNRKTVKVSSSSEMGKKKDVTKKVVGGLRKYKCRFCDYMALSVSSVRTHIFKHHSTKDKYKCSKSPIQVESLQEITTHMFHKHPWIVNSGLNSTHSVPADVITTNVGSKVGSTEKPQAFFPDTRKLEKENYTDKLGQLKRQADTININSLSKNRHRKSSETRTVEPSQVIFSEANSENNEHNDKVSENYKHNDNPSENNESDNVAPENNDNEITERIEEASKNLFSTEGDTKHGITSMNKNTNLNLHYNNGKSTKIKDRPINQNQENKSSVYFSANYKTKETYLTDLTDVRNEGKMCKDSDGGGDIDHTTGKENSPIQTSLFKVLSTSNQSLYSDISDESLDSLTKSDDGKNNFFNTDASSRENQASNESMENNEVDDPDWKKNSPFEAFANLYSDISDESTDSDVTYDASQNNSFDDINYATSKENKTKDKYLHNDEGMASSKLRIMKSSIDSACCIDNNQHNPEIKFSHGNLVPDSAIEKNKKYLDPCDSSVDEKNVQGLIYRPDDCDDESLCSAEENYKKKKTNNNHNNDGVHDGEYICNKDYSDIDSPEMSDDMNNKVAVTTPQQIQIDLINSNSDDNRLVATKKKLKSGIHFQCLKCQFTCSSKQKTFANHLKKVHGILKYVQCSHCSARYTDIKSVKRHMNFFHKDKCNKYKSLPLKLLFKEVPSGKNNIPTEIVPLDETPLEDQKEGLISDKPEISADVKTTKKKKLRLHKFYMKHSFSECTKLPVTTVTHQINPAPKEKSISFGKIETLLTNNKLDTSKSNTGCPILKKNGVETFNESQDDSETQCDANKLSGLETQFPQVLFMLSKKGKTKKQKTQSSDVCTKTEQPQECLLTNSDLLVDKVNFTEEFKKNTGAGDDECIKYGCKYCDFKGTDTSVMKQHLLDNVLDKQSKCKFCLHSFTSSEKQAVHAKEANKNVPANKMLKHLEHLAKTDKKLKNISIKDQVRNKKFPLKVNIKCKKLPFKKTAGSNISAGRRNKHFKCFHCNKRTFNLEGLKIHYGVKHHTISKKYRYWIDEKTGQICSMSGAVFQNKKKAVSYKGGFLCGYCNKRSNKRSKVIKHQQLQHGKKIGFVVNLNNTQVIKSQKNLIKNSSSTTSVKSSEPVPKKLKRDKKPLTDISGSGLSDTNTASKQRAKINYCCNRCSFRENSLYLYRRHLASHGTFRYLSCDILQSSPLKCGCCNYIASDEKDFSSHVATHMSFERPYKCGYCGYDSFSRSNVRKHVTSLHPGKKEKVIDRRKSRVVPRFTSGAKTLVNIEPVVRIKDIMTVPAEEFGDLLLEHRVTTIDLSYITDDRILQILKLFGRDIPEDQLHDLLTENA